MDRKLYWIWALSKPKMTPSKLSAVLDAVGEIDEIYKADASVFKKHGIKRDVIKLLCDKSLDRANQIVFECENLGIDIMTYDDEDYPHNLVMLYDPPYVLYIAGNRFNLNDRLSIALVGSRECGDYGEACAKQLAYDLAKCGVVVVSGLAEGGDTAALSGAINAGGTVVSVVANGLDICYPAENYDIMKRVMQSGMVISEYPPATEPNKFSFPIRNRIISGISNGTVVTSAKESSGTLITAKSALNQSKDVFAIPGSINNPHSQGTNNLIKSSSAKLVTSAADILVEYADYFMSVNKEIKNKKDLIAFAEKGETQRDNQQSPEKEDRMAKIRKNYVMSPNEQIVMDMLTMKPTHIDEIAKAVPLPESQLSMLLTMLELHGFIKSLPGNSYCLNIY